MNDESIEKLKFNTTLIEKIVNELPPIENMLGKPLFVLVFNFGCPGCLHRAIPFMNKLSIDYSEQINFIGIHTNHEGVDFSNFEIETLVHKHHINFPIFKDKNFNDFYYKYQATGTPHWFIFNEKLELTCNMFGSDPNRGLLKLLYIVDEMLLKK